jgi:hypothetical protein
MQALEMENKFYTIIFGSKSDKNVKNLEKEIKKENARAQQDYAKHYKELTNIDQLKTKLDAKNFDLSHLRMY